MPGGFAEQERGADRSDQKEQDQQRQLVIGNERHVREFTGAGGSGNRPHEVVGLRCFVRLVPAPGRGLFVLYKMFFGVW